MLRGRCGGAQRSGEEGRPAGLGEPAAPGGEVAEGCPFRLGIRRALGSASVGSRWSGQAPPVAGARLGVGGLQEGGGHCG